MPFEIELPAQAAAPEGGGGFVIEMPPSRPAVPQGQRPGPQHVPGPDGRPVPKPAAAAPDTRSLPDRLLDRFMAPAEMALTGISGAIGGLGAAARGATDLVSGVAATAGRAALGRPQPGPAPEGQRTEDRMIDTMQRFTYQPRGLEAQEGLRTIQELLGATKIPMDPTLGNVVMPARPMLPTGPGEFRKTTVGTPADIVGVTAGPARAATGVIRGELDRPEFAIAERNAPTMAGGGAAMTEAATQARTTAGGLPVPVPITNAEALRDQAMLRRQGELAKDDSAAGRLVRANDAEKNRAIAQNFEVLVDGLEAIRTENPEALGELVSGRVLTAGERRLKARHQATYAAAEQAGHMAEQIDMSPLVRWIETNRSSSTMAPIVGMVESELIRLGAVRKMPNGELTPLRLGINDLEEVRKLMVSNAKGGNTNDQRLALAANRVIDDMTEGRGGELYRQARSEFREFANVYRNNGLVRDLLALKPGTTDRRVAYEKVWDKIAVAPNDSIRHLMGTLESIGPEGVEALREIQAMTIRQGARRALGNTAMDEQRNIIPSPAKFNRWVEVMDREGKLDLLAGPRAAAVLRDMRETMLNVQTMPPGTLNSSNTWSLMREAFKELATGHFGPAVFNARNVFGALRKERDDLRFAREILPPQIPRGLQGAVQQQP